jgi:hypothetical protein
LGFGTVVLLLEVPNGLGGVIKFLFREQWGSGEILDLFVELSRSWSFFLNSKESLFPRIEAD